MCDSIYFVVASQKEFRRISGSVLGLSILLVVMIFTSFDTQEASSIAAEKILHIKVYDENGKAAPDGTRCWVTLDIPGYSYQTINDLTSSAGIIQLKIDGNTDRLTVSCFYDGAFKAESPWISIDKQSTWVIVWFWLSPPPAVVTDLTATAVFTTQIDLAWTSPEDFGDPIIGYEIYRDACIGTTPTVMHVMVAMTSWFDTDLTAGVTCAYHISAMNSAGKALPSNTASATTFAAPDVIIDLIATAVSTTQIDLSWTAPADNGSPITGYQIERDSGAGFSLVGSNSFPTFNDSGLTAGTTYNYRVIAINSGGTSLSNEASATTFAAPVEEPTTETAPVEEPTTETAPVEEPTTETAPV